MASDPVVDTAVGPSLRGRLLGWLALVIQGLGLLGLALSVIAFLYGRPDFLDLALAYALINFIGILAVLEFFRSRAERDADERRTEI